jgi:hypothetical protein
VKLRKSLMGWQKEIKIAKKYDRSPRRGSNSRPFAYEANALPLCYGGWVAFYFNNENKTLIILTNCIAMFEEGKNREKKRKEFFSNGKSKEDERDVTASHRDDQLEPASVKS